MRSGLRLLPLLLLAYCVVVQTNHRLPGNLDAFGADRTLTTIRDKPRADDEPRVSTSEDTVKGDAAAERVADGAGRSAVAVAEDPSVLVLPLLPYGLSNQVIALKEALALSSVLNWTVVVYGFWPHYSETNGNHTAAAPAPGLGSGGPAGSSGHTVSDTGPEAKGSSSSDGTDGADDSGVGEAAGSSSEEGATAWDPPADLIPFDLIYDRSALQSLVRVLSLQEAAALGLLRSDGTAAGRDAEAGSSGSRKLSATLKGARNTVTRSRSAATGPDAGDPAHRIQRQIPIRRPDKVLVLSHSSGREGTYERAEAAGVAVQGAPVAATEHFKCNEEGLEWLSKATATRPAWVALYSYLGVTPLMRTEFLTRGASECSCREAYHRVSLHLKKSRLVVAAAQGFIAGVLAPAAEGQLPAPPPPPAARGSGRRLLSGRRGSEGEHEQADESQDASAKLQGKPSASSSADAQMTASPSSAPFYVAVHVRPHPDTCIQYFASFHHFKKVAAGEVCTNPRFLSKLVRRLRGIAAERAAAAVHTAHTRQVRHAPAQSQPALTVFVMSHPAIRRAVFSEVARLWAIQEDKEAKPRRAAAPAALPAPTLVFLDSGQLPAALRDHVAHTSLLSMVEQEVCRAAPVFLGTTLSSISVLVAQERAAEAAQAGVTEHHKHTELLH
ncbi:hypothetical protein HYH03_009803 [Edaphochlamys debaryana]|uniref:Uncharacterized protein n=1 Tax=Edaphochlamys debaryana TaxID=47281 RepID=A0A836BXB3_9CHLO|nr:hypothetical protein HYH03_009803 [Edaphochlamys debaryana]|eukprot:KAG2491847.1 hypothetical protein HYH03_009803 [Edaphochlamys debaryana]